MDNESIKNIINTVLERIKSNNAHKNEVTKIANKLKSLN